MRFVEPKPADQQAQAVVFRTREQFVNQRTDLVNALRSSLYEFGYSASQNWMFAGSEGGGKAMASAFTLIETAKLNNVDPQAWRTWVLAQITDHKITRLDELLPWRYAAQAA